MAACFESGCRRVKNFKTMKLTTELIRGDAPAEVTMPELPKLLSRDTRHFREEQADTNVDADAEEAKGVGAGGFAGVTSKGSDFEPTQRLPPLPPPGPSFQGEHMLDLVCFLERRLKRQVQMLGVRGFPNNIWEGLESTLLC